MNWLKQWDELDVGIILKWFYAGTIQILEQLIMNFHKRNEKIIKFQQGKRTTKNENHRAEKYQITI